MMENFSDTDLLVAEDSHTAFAIIYNRYWERLYKKALVRFGNDADAQDAVQEVFISLWRNKHTIEAANTLSPYLFAALKYCIIKKIYRKAKKGEYVTLSLSVLEKFGGYEENQFQLKELQSVLRKELDNLPTKMRRIYDLSRVENLRTTEIAEQLHISEQTVKNTLTTALKRLRKRIAHYADFLLQIAGILFFIN
ncbi:MAG: sigma-70 family RNA polymerase sigma factor [Ferruginibacter sp.]